MIDYDGDGPKIEDERELRLGKINLRGSIVSLDISSRDDEHGNPLALCEVRAALLRARDGASRGAPRRARSVLAATIPNSLAGALKIPPASERGGPALFFSAGAFQRFDALGKDLAWLAERGKIGGWEARMDGRNVSWKDIMSAVGARSSSLHLGQMGFEGGLFVGALDEERLLAGMAIPNAAGEFDIFATFNEFGELADVCFIRSDQELSAKAAESYDAWREMGNWRGPVPLRGEGMVIAGASNAAGEEGGREASSFYDHFKRGGLEIRGSSGGRAIFVGGPSMGTAQVAVAIGADGRVEGARAMIDRRSEASPGVLESARARALEVERARISQAAAPAQAGPKRALRM